MFFQHGLGTQAANGRYVVTLRAVGRARWKEDPAIWIKSKGIAIYGGNGRFATIASYGRTKFASNNAMAGTDHENKAIGQGATPYRKLVCRRTGRGVHLTD